MNPNLSKKSFLIVFVIFLSVTCPIIFWHFTQSEELNRPTKYEDTEPTLNQRQAYLEDLPQVEDQSYSQNNEDRERTWSCGSEYQKRTPVDTVPIKNARGFCTSYSKNSSNAFFDGDPLPVKSVGTFHVFGTSEAYASDGLDVYFYGVKMDGVDAKTFSPLYDTNGRDTLLSSDKSSIFLVSPHSRTVRSATTLPIQDLGLWKKKHGWDLLPVEDTSN